jgi:hypothetical protein
MYSMQTDSLVLEFNTSAMPIQPCWSMQAVGIFTGQEKKEGWMLGCLFCHKSRVFSEVHSTQTPHLIQGFNLYHFLCLSVFI